MKLGLVALLILSSVPVNAHEFQTGYSRTQVCSKTIYKEKYIPGTYENPGYVKSWKESIEVPCNRHVSHHHHYRNNYYQPRRNYSVSRSNTSSRSCNASRTTGGLLGGGLAAALSKKDAYAWSIPLGAVVGMGVGSADC